jgi:hypothetical protein
VKRAVHAVEQEGCFSPPTAVEGWLFQLEPACSLLAAPLAMCFRLLNACANPAAKAGAPVQGQHVDPVLCLQQAVSDRAIVVTHVSLTLSLMHISRLHVLSGYLRAPLGTTSRRHPRMPPDGGTHDVVTYPL